MTEDQARALLESNLQGMFREAKAAGLPAELVAGYLIGAGVSLARADGASREQVELVVEMAWEEQSPTEPPPEAPPTEH